MNETNYYIYFFFYRQDLFLTKLYLKDGLFFQIGKRVVSFIGNKSLMVYGKFSICDLRFYLY